MKKEYPYRKNYYTTIFKLPVTLLLFLGLPLLVQAQMFSVDNSRKSSLTPAVAVFAGIEPIDFDYEGDASTVGAGAYDFSGTLIRFKLESSGVNIYLGAGGSTTGLDDVSYFDAGLQYGYGIGLYRTSSFLLQLPVRLQSSFTSVGNDDMVVIGAPEFQQGTFALGGGLSMDAKLASQFRIRLNLIPGYGFSFSTRERDAGGSIATLAGQGRLYFDHLFGNSGLSLGYDYNARRFDIDGEALDYSASAHSILIGITF